MNDNKVISLTQPAESDSLQTNLQTEASYVERISPKYLSINVDFLDFL